VTSLVNGGLLWPQYFTNKQRGEKTKNLKTQGGEKNLSIPGFGKTAAVRACASKRDTKKKAKGRGETCGGRVIQERVSSYNDAPFSFCTKGF